MQSSSTSSVAQPEAILNWLQKEMGYRPLGPYIGSNKASMPSSDGIRRVCRGNMIPVFNFLLKRVKSEKTVIDIRRNITVHGSEDNTEATTSGEVGKGIRGAKRKEKPKGRIESTSAGDIHTRESALQERESAEKEVKRLRHIVRRQRKELKARMFEVSREEADRKRMLDERSNYRHKQVTLEAYDRQCDEAVKIFSQYHKHLSSYVNQAKGCLKLEPDSSKSEENDIFLNETNRERNIRKACEWLAEHMTKRIHNSFPAYEGIGIHSNPQQETSKLGIDLEGNVPDEIQDMVLNSLKSPRQLLLSVITYTQRLKSIIAKEIEKIDIRADAETLRYKYENNRVMDASPDVSSPLQSQLYGNGNIASKGTQNQLLERQKAHVQQFVATEDQLNKAAEAKSVFQNLLKHLYGSSDEDSSLSYKSSLRQLELEVWDMEREAAGLKASLTTLMSEVHRLTVLCEDRKQAEDSLKKNWKKIEEFESRRLELEFIYNALMKANMGAIEFWSQQPLTAREHASNTIIPECAVVINITHNTKDLIEKEVSMFSRVPDNTLYMLPSTPQALLESMIPSGSTGPESVIAAEKIATLLTAKAGSGDPSAIPSISRVSAALQHPAGSEASLASVLESMEFCLKLRGSEASLLEDLSNALNLVHTRRELVESGHALLNHAYHTQKENKGTTNYCLDLASEQDEIVSEKWMPQLKNGVSNAQKSLEDCKYVCNLLDEWWEQPASTVVDWVTVDGQNVTAWNNHVKQLLTFYDSELL
ncbi:hypothetical protein L1887_10354 [Cichorium endivia]|nr:hypothetical protein L1887_10354 [Cichorium endivia]